MNLFNLGLVRSSELENLRKLELTQEAIAVDFQILKRAGSGFSNSYLKLRDHSNSALRQDILALLINENRKNGFL